MHAFVRGSLAKVPVGQAVACVDLSGQYVPASQTRHASGEVLLEFMLYVPAGHAVSEADSGGQ